MVRTFAAASVPLSLALAFGAPRTDAATIALRPLSAHTASAVTTRCAADAPAAIDAAFFEVPAIAREMHVSGESLIRIDLDAAGRLRAASMQHSSGNRWLDRAAMQSAQLSRYRPAIESCSRIGGSYLIAVDVTEDDVR
jgi:TonB family protein